MLPSWPGEPPKSSTRHTHSYISTYINIIMMICTTESSKIFQYNWILSWLVPQGLTKPRQMLVVKDTCMAAIEYFTEPGDHLSILIILIDVVIVIEYLTEPGDQLPPHYQTLLLLLLLLLTHKKTTQASSANNKKNANMKKKPPRHHGGWVVVREATGENFENFSPRKIQKHFKKKMPFAYYENLKKSTFQSANNCNCHYNG